jgi:thymidylate synthase ThyX
MRLCYNAQEEIWRASLEEARHIRDVHPRLGSWLLPPCTQRAMAGQKPPCPEGARYCGVPVWRIDLDRYERTL